MTKKRLFQQKKSQQIFSIFLIIFCFLYIFQKVSPIILHTQILNINKITIIEIPADIYKVKASKISQILQNNIHIKYKLIDNFQDHEIKENFDIISPPAILVLKSRDLNQLNTCVDNITTISNKIKIHKISNHNTSNPQPDLIWKILDILLALILSIYLTYNRIKSYCVPISKLKALSAPKFYIYKQVLSAEYCFILLVHLFLISINSINIYNYFIQQINITELVINMIISISYIIFYQIIIIIKITSPSFDGDRLC